MGVPVWCAGVWQFGLPHLLPRMWQYLLPRRYSLLWQCVAVGSATGVAVGSATGVAVPAATSILSSLWGNWGDRSATSTENLLP